MLITPEQELENAITKVNYHTICDLFELTAAQRTNPHCGQWIVNTIKQFQTSATLARAAKLVKSEMQLDPSPTPLPISNPLLPKDSTTG